MSSTDTYDIVIVVPDKNQWRTLKSLAKRSNIDTFPATPDIPHKMSARLKYRGSTHFPGVACHVDGTTWARFLPRSWDHPACRDGRRLGGLVRSSCSVLFAGVEVADDGVPGGRRG